MCAIDLDTGVEVDPDSLNEELTDVIASKLRVEENDYLAGAPIHEFTQTVGPYWSERLLAAKSLDNLPLTLKCRQSGLELFVDYALTSEVTSRLPEMMKESSERGDNIGMDELDGPYFEYLTEMADIFAVRKWNVDNNPDDIKAFIIVAISLHTRTFDSCLADIRVIRSRDLTDADYFDVIRLTVDLAKRLDCGFTDCLLPVAKSCDSLIEVLIGQLGFRVAVTLPQSVNMAAGVGLTDSLLMIYNLGITDRPRRSKEEVTAYLAKFGIADGPEDDAWFQSLTLPTLPFLPFQYRFQKSGLLVNFRNMKTADDRAVFELIEESAQRGEGFDSNDIVNLAAARHLFLADYPSVMAEDVDKKTIVAWMILTPCWFARSPLSKYGESCLVVSKEYQSLGIGNELSVLALSLAALLDYERLVMDHFANNIRSDKLNKLVGAVQLGTIPRCGYLVGNGWTDVVVTCKEVKLDERQTLIELIERSRLNSQTPPTS